MYIACALRICLMLPVLSMGAHCCKRSTYIGLPSENKYL